MQKINFFLCVILLLFFAKNGASQIAQLNREALHISIDSAENIYLHNNLLLLAQHYNIDATKALEVQAKLYPNPNVSLTTTLAYSANNKFIVLPLPFTNNGEIQGAVSQEIVLAGKINKAVKLAQANTKLSEYQFFDLIRTLKFSLRNNFYTIYFLQQSATVYKEEIDNLQTVVDAYNQLQGKGYIAEKEVVRIKAQLLSLQSEYQNLIDQINDNESELRLLLQLKSNTYIFPIIDNNTLNNNPLKYSLATLLDSAYKGRTDLMIAKANSDISKLNYDYQKALAKPNITAGWSYDQQGAFNNNWTGIGVAMDLPFFNKNQGNIKSAKATIKVNEATQKSTELTLEENVFRALEKAVDADNLYKKIDPSFGKDYDRLMQAALEQYKRRIVTLLDFLDFYDSYKQNTLQINTIKFNKLNALEEINFYTGSNFFN